MQKIDPCDNESSLEDVSAQQIFFFTRENSIAVRGDDNLKFTRPVYSITFMIAGGRLPSIKEMTMDGYGSKILNDVDQETLKMPSKIWEKKGLMLMG
jgi:hypothetical protein